MSEWLFIFKSIAQFGGIFEFINQKWKCFLILFIRLYTWTRKRQTILRMPALAPKTTRKKPSPVSFNSICSLSMTENHLTISLKCKSVISKTLAVFQLSANPYHFNPRNRKWLKPKAKQSAKKKSSLKRTLKLQSHGKEEYSIFNAKSKT